MAGVCGDRGRLRQLASKLQKQPSVRVFSAKIELALARGMTPQHWAAALGVYPT